MTWTPGFRTGEVDAVLHRPRVADNEKSRSCLGSHSRHDGGLLARTLRRIRGEPLPAHRRGCRTQVDLRAPQEVGSRVEDPLAEVALLGIYPSVWNIELTDHAKGGQHLRMPIGMLAVEVEDALKRIAQHVTGKLGGESADETMLPGGAVLILVHYDARVGPLQDGGERTVLENTDSGVLRALVVDPLGIVPEPGQARVESNQLQRPSVDRGHAEAFGPHA